MENIGDAKLRAVMLNTNLYTTDNLATQGQTDPAGQYEWLEQTLSTARTHGEKVNINH